MKYFSIILALLILSFEPSFAGKNKKSSKYTFKLATLAPERSVWIEAYDGMTDEVFEKTEGLVKFKCYPGGIQGDELTVIRKMRIGQLHGAGLTGTGLSLICKDSLVFQLPLIFDNEEEVDYVLPKLIPLLEAQCNKNGYEVLAWPRLGFSYCFSKKSVTDIDSLRSAKPWLLEDDVISKEFFNQANVSAIPAKIGDVLTGLRSGLIHTIFAPPVGMISLQWFTGVENQLDLKLIYSVGTIVIANKKWNRLPGEIQSQIKEISKKHFTELDRKVREQNDEALKVMSKKGIHTLPPTEKGRQQFQEISASIAKKLVGKAFSEKSLALLRSSLQNFRKEISN